MLVFKQPKDYKYQLLRFNKTHKEPTGHKQRRRILEVIKLSKWTWARHVTITEGYGRQPKLNGQPQLNGQQQNDWSPTDANKAESEKGNMG